MTVEFYGSLLPSRRPLLGYLFFGSMQLGSAPVPGFAVVDLNDKAFSELTENSWLS
jgi:hypothetical protein